MKTIADPAPGALPSRRRTRDLRLPALAIRQGRRVIYSFAVDGKQLPTFTTISRVHRDDAAQIGGYQRPEVLAHIASIRRYLETEDAMLPNALVVAFDKRVSFEPSESLDGRGPVRTGTLVIPVDPRATEEDKPGWVVDGQQRCAAIREARIRSFPVCVTAFITESEAEQRSQFILVNSTKPLPKGLIYELLPSTSGILPVPLQVRRFPALLVERLNYDPSSPLRGMIHTPTTPQGVVKDNSVLRMVENSLTDGALYQFRNSLTGDGDAEVMLGMLRNFWVSVRDVFPDAWGLPPRRSRLMHGVGIVSLGFLMDAIADRHSRGDVPSASNFSAGLGFIHDVCRWTEGTWDFGHGYQRRWNDLQNTPRDIQLLADFLLAKYEQRLSAAVRNGSRAKMVNARILETESQERLAL
jgi:DGQHR domain-containing protein